MSPLLPGGVSSLVAPGNDSEPGAVNAFAWAAFEGCVCMPSIFGVGITRRKSTTGWCCQADLIDALVNAA